MLDSLRAGGGSSGGVQAARAGQHAQQTEMQQKALMQFAISFSQDMSARSQQSMDQMVSALKGEHDEPDEDDTDEPL